MIEFLASVDWGDIASLVVALAALLVAKRSLEQNREHQKLTVRPWITAHYRTQEDIELALELENRGLGPAVLRRWAFWHASAPDQRAETAQSGELERVINNVMPHPSVRFTFSSRKRDSVLKSGEVWRPFELKAGNSNLAEMAKIKNIVEGFCMEIQYESLYQDVFSESVSFWKKR